MARFAVILPAAGRSSRFGDSREKKVFADLNGRAVWLRAADLFVQRPDVGQVILAINPEDQELFERRYQANALFFGIKVVEGGQERADTVANALEAIDSSCDYVAIHDAARPCLTSERIDAVFQAAIEHGAAALGTPIRDTVKRVDNQNQVVATVSRDNLWAVQTPQVFRRDWIEQGLAKSRQSEQISKSITDDLMLIEAIGKPCVLVEGSSWNIKITVKDDLLLASSLFSLISKLKTKPEPQFHPFADPKDLPEDLPGLRFEDLF